MLKRVPLFSGCDATELGAIAAVVERRRATVGEELITGGAPASHLIVVLEGEALVLRDGREVNRVRAGEFTGEMAALEGHHYTATVVAATPMDLLAVPAAEAARLLEHRGVAGRLMSRVVGWLRPLASSGPSRPDPRDAAWSAITAAEQRVIDLVAAGRSNPQVAAELFISRYTVESHLKSVYAKLGVTSRTELAVEAQRRKTAGA